MAGITGRRPPVAPRSGTEAITSTVDRPPSITPLAPFTRGVDVGGGGCRRLDGTTSGAHAQYARPTPTRYPILMAGGNRSTPGAAGRAPARGGCRRSRERSTMYLVIGVGQAAPVEPTGPPRDRRPTSAGSGDAGASATATPVPPRRGSPRPSRDPRPACPAAGSGCRRLPTAGGWVPRSHGRPDGTRGVGWTVFHGEPSTVTRPHPTPGAPVCGDDGVRQPCSARSCDGYRATANSLGPLGVPGSRCG